MTGQRHSYLAVLAAPALAAVVLQLAGCAPRTTPQPPPPGGSYISMSAGASFEQSVDLVDETGHTIGNTAGFSLQKLYRVSHHPQRLYITLGLSSVLYSDNGGENWQELHTPLATTSGIADLENGILLAGGTATDRSGAVVRSLDRGKSWETVLTIPTPPEPKRRRFEIIKSPDRGQPGSVITTMVADPHIADRVYAATSLGDILVGEQSGKLWHALTAVKAGRTDPITGRRLGGILDLIPSPHRANEVLVIPRTRQLFRLRDELVEAINVTVPGGSTKQVFDAIYVQQFPDALFVGASDAALISRDGGATWEQLDLPVSAPRPYSTVAVAVSPTNPARMLVAVNSVVLRSEDGGLAWSTHTLGLPSHTITDLSIDPTNAARVILTTTPLNL